MYTKKAITNKNRDSPQQRLAKQDPKQKSGQFPVCYLIVEYRRRTDDDD